MAVRQTPGERLYQIRVEIFGKISQERFAALLRVPQRTYQRYETGETKKVPAEVLARAEALALRKQKRSA